MALLIVAIALLGLAIGSFLNVVIYRVPLKLSLSRPGSACPSCGHEIRNRHNIPVIGWLVLRGRCADCDSAISVRYPAVELLTAVLFVAITLQAAHLHLLPALPAFLFFAAVGVALTMIDVDVRRLPNAIVLPAYPVLAVLLTAGAFGLHDPSALLRAAIGASGLFALYFALIFVYPGGMGLGDVKLAGVVGGFLAFISYQALLIGAFSAFLIGALIGALVVARRRGPDRTAIPFGPFMVTGALVALFAAAPITDFYTHLALGA